MHIFTFAYSEMGFFYTKMNIIFGKIFLFLFNYMLETEKTMNKILSIAIPIVSRVVDYFFVHNYSPIFSFGTSANGHAFFTMIR